MITPFDNAGFRRAIHRRTFLGRTAFGLGSVALAGLLNGRAEGASSGRWRGVVNPPHLPVKAKRVIHLCMAGGPSQFETLDFKPELKRLDGKPFPESFTKGQQLAQLQNTVLTARGPVVEFHRHGQSGQATGADHVERRADQRLTQIAVVVAALVGTTHRWLLDGEP